MFNRAQAEGFDSLMGRHGCVPHPCIKNSGNLDPIAYIKVVAVKKLVVEVWSRTLGLLNCMYLTVRDFLLGERPPSGGPEPGLLL